jgi:hypothetical protein
MKSFKPFLPLVIAAVIFGGAVGAYAFGYYELLASVKQAATLTQTVAAKKVATARLMTARAQLSTLADDEARLQQYTIDKNTIVPFLETLQSAGKPYGASVSVLSVADEKTGTHGRVSLSLSIAGSFDAVMRTLGTIEYAPYDGIVKSATLSTAATGTTPVWNASVVYSVSVATSTKP